MWCHSLNCNGAIEWSIHALMCYCFQNTSVPPSPPPSLAASQFPSHVICSEPAGESARRACQEGRPRGPVSIASQEKYCVREYQRASRRWGKFQVFRYIRMVRNFCHNRMRTKNRTNKVLKENARCAFEVSRLRCLILLDTSSTETNAPM